MASQTPTPQTPEPQTPEPQTPTPESTAPRQARELGAVQWQRRLEPALDEAKRSSKPVLLLFQEVPG